MTSPLQDRPLEREVPLAFVLTTTQSSGHPHAGYTHKCEVTLLGEQMWTLWGRSAPEAEQRAEREIINRIRRPLRGY